MFLSSHCSPEWAKACMSESVGTADQLLVTSDCSGLWVLSEIHGHWGLAFSLSLPCWSRKALSSQFSSVAQSCPTLCDPMGYSIPGFPVYHQLPELIQTHVHQVYYGIQSSHPLLSPSPLAFNLSQHQGLFQWISSSRQWPKYWSFSSVLPMNIQDWFPLGLTGLISLQSKGLSRVFSNSAVQKHQFFSASL